MTTRAPIRTLSLDQIHSVTLRDPVLGKSSMLRDIDAQQWALMTAYGAPGFGGSVYWPASGGTAATFRCGLRVPPTVKHVAIQVLAAGNGTVEVVSANDAAGSTFDVHTRPDGLVDVTHAEWQSSAGGSTTVASNEGRLLKVVASPALTWQDEDLTITVDPIGTDDLEVYGWVVVPIFGTYDDDPGFVGAFSSGFSNGFS